MLDERTSVLLNIINKICSSGSYSVVTSDELILKFPEKFGADSDLIRQMIINLSQKGYVSLRYDRDDEYCIAPTPKGRLFTETEPNDVTKNKKSVIIDLLPHFFNFLSIFFAIVTAFSVLKAIGVLC